jgi:hypothetical protein
VLLLTSLEDVPSQGRLLVVQHHHPAGHTEMPLRPESRPPAVTTTVVANHFAVKLLREKGTIAQGNVAIYRGDVKGDAKDLAAALPEEVCRYGPLLQLITHVKPLHHNLSRLVHPLQDPGCFKVHHGSLFRELWRSQHVLCRM